MSARAQVLPPSSDQAHVLIPDGEDPWVVSHQGVYYHCAVGRPGTSVVISKFADIKEMGTAEFKRVWPGDHGEIPTYTGIWAPELQRLDDQWFIYMALYKGDGTSIGDERVHVLEGLSDDAQGEYAYKGQLAIGTDRWSIDGTVLEIPRSGDRYFVWSGWEEYVNDSQNLYIAHMKNPWTLDSDRVCISRPEYDWEKHGYPYINEAPQSLINGEHTFIIYSASGSWTDDYCLGQLRLIGDDPLDPHSWHKHPQPVFKKTETIFGPGHCSFVKDSDGTDIVVYHTQRSSGAGWARQVRYKAFAWNADGSPNFGEPI